MSRAREIVGACLLAVIGALVGVRIVYRQIDVGVTFPASPPQPRLRVVS